MARLSLPREARRAFVPRDPPSKTINHAFVPAAGNVITRTLFGQIGLGPNPPISSAYINDIYGTGVILDPASYTNQTHVNNFHAKTWSMEMMYMHSTANTCGFQQLGMVNGINGTAKFANTSPTSANSYAECAIMTCSAFSPEYMGGGGAIQPYSYSDAVQGLYFSIHPNGWIKHFRRYGDSPQQTGGGSNTNVAMHFSSATFTPGIWNHIAISYVYDSVTPANSRFKYYINGYKHLDLPGFIPSGLAAQGPWVKQGDLMLCRSGSMALVHDALPAPYGKDLKTKIRWVLGAPYENYYPQYPIAADHKYKYIRFLNYDAWPDGGFEIPDPERSFEGTGKWMPGINVEEPYPGKNIPASNEIIKIDFSNVMTVNDVVDSSPNNWPIRKSFYINNANVKYVSSKQKYKY